LTVLINGSVSDPDKLEEQPDGAEEVRVLFQGQLLTTIRGFVQFDSARGWYIKTRRGRLWALTNLDPNLWEVDITPDVNAD
jgi:hypothetical protein